MQPRARNQPQELLAPSSSSCQLPGLSYMKKKRKKKCGEKPGGNWTENVLSTGVKQYVKAGALCSGDSHLRRQVLCLLWVAERGLAPEMTFCPAVSLASTFKE